MVDKIRGGQDEQLANIRRDMMDGTRSGQVQEGPLPDDVVGLSHDDIVNICEALQVAVESMTKASMQFPGDAEWDEYSEGYRTTYNRVLAIHVAMHLG